MRGDDQQRRRVVVTGLGISSPIGCSSEAVWQSLLSGQTGISPSSEISSDSEHPIFAGEARDFTGKIGDFGELDPPIRKSIRKALKVMNRETKLALAATQHALADSQLSEAGLEPERIGVCFGAGNVSILPQDFLAGIEACTNDEGSFEFDQWGTEGLPLVEPLWLLRCLPNMPACHIAICNDFRGPNNSITQREASANLALAEATHLIAEGMADAHIAGGTGTTILPFNRLHTMLEHDDAPTSDEAATVCRPFDEQRAGSVISEGAAAFVLEEYECAVRRGAHIYAESLGGGSSCVVSSSRVPHCGTALTNALNAALKNARIDRNSIGHVHAHGLGTRRSDVEESQAIRAVFDDRAETLPIVAAKSYTGNAGAGSGAMELATSLLALEHGHLFPVLNYETPDPECPLNIVRSTDIEAGETFLNLNVSSEGQASCLAVRKAA